MPKLELLNNRDHHSLAMRAVDLGGRHFVQIVAQEFATAATYCPVIFSKNPETGRFYAGAMLGFKSGESLLNSDEVSAAGFRPFDLIRQGFFITGEQVAIDVEHPRFATGDPLFDDHGVPTLPLREVQQVLGRFKHGIEETEAFIDALMVLKLIEPIDVTLRFDDGKVIDLAGVYTISLDALGDLDDAQALKLFRNGWLQLAYTMIGSLKQIGVLAARRNRALAR